MPGYTAQQSTIQTQAFFTMFIGLLVIGGFFQIQMLQKVAQIGVLKAIGASNQLVTTASIFQIIIVTIYGVAIGVLFTYLLSLSFPPTIPDCIQRAAFHDCRGRLADDRSNRGVCFYPLCVEY